MKWLIYFGLTVVVYGLILLKLRGKTEREKVKEAYIFWMALIFFFIFEYIFIESLFSNILLHLVGLLLSFIYAITIYFYLKSLKKDVDSIFYKLLETNQGKISILTFMQATELSPEEAQEYLNQKIKDLRGSRHTTRGNIYYKFNTWY